MTAPAAASGPGPSSATYTLRQIQDMLEAGRSAVLGFVEAGLVTPQRGPRNEYRFSFQDVVLLRTAQRLRAARIAPRRLLQSLRQLKARLPVSLPLSGLRITAVGNDVAVHDGQAQVSAASGQLLLDFEVTPDQGRVAFIERAPTRVTAPRSGTGPHSAAADPAEGADAEPATADGWLARGQQLEESDAAAAEAAYRSALAVDAAHAGSALNLGALLCEEGRCAEAVALYRDALRHRADEPLLHYNHAIALEDQGHDAAALDSYRRCLALAPEMADAHYNAARLHEKLGQPQRALRHYSAYRRLRND